MELNKIKLKQYIEDNGILTPIELNGDIIPFKVKRFFHVYNVPKGDERGKHAHYKTQQVLICLKGSIKVKVFDGKSRKSKVINEGEAVYIPNMIWDSQVYLTGDDILLSVCSTKYNKNDYILDLEEFKRLTK